MLFFDFFSEFRFIWLQTQALDAWVTPPVHELAFQKAYVLKALSQANYWKVIES
jgi:hypothetical protein